VVVRGDFDALIQLSLPEHIRIAVEQARAYDAATSLFSRMFASRRNYDVAQGRNARGQWRSGVLEQSWRVGGATGAEIAALEAFRADPDLQVVRASTFEIYGESEAPPPQATVYFRGLDEHVGLLTKYTVVGAHGDTR
jgi:GDP-D-mannose dehydratase